MIKELIALITLFATSIVQYLLDYILNDKESKIYKITRLILIVFMLLAFSASIILLISNYYNSINVQNNVVQLQQKYNELLIQYHEDKNKAHEDSIALQNKIDNLQAVLLPFIQVAQTKYPGENIDTALDKLRIEIEKLKEKTRPNSLIYKYHNIQKVPEGYIVQLHYRRSKDEQIGQLDFDISVNNDNSSQIIKISPNIPVMLEHCWISLDRKSSKYNFTPFSPEGDIVYEITVSNKTIITIKGNKGLHPLKITM